MARKGKVLSMHRRIGKSKMKEQADRALQGELARARLRDHFQEARALIELLPCGCDGLRGPDGRVVGMRTTCRRCAWLSAGDLSQVAARSETWRPIEPEAEKGDES